MTIPPPAQIGAPFSEIDTPALVIDLDALERNLDAMAAAGRRLGVRLRPHAKTHKSPVIAAKQIARGAAGICCQKLAEAEIFVASGIGDVLITNEIVGPQKLERLAHLGRQARIGVCADNAGAVETLAAAAERAGSHIEVLVEIDVGQRRCGVPPGPAAVELAAKIASFPSLSFAGLQAYSGSAQHMRTLEERRAAISSARELTAETVRLLGRAGFECRTVGGGGTGTYELEGASGVWNELQPGSYVFMDADYAKNSWDREGGAPVFEHALFVLAAVMSLSTGWGVADAGHKALSNDSGFPTVFGKTGVSYEQPSDEHGVLNLGSSPWRPTLGEKLLLIPGHCDPTVNLYDWFVGVRHFGTPRACVEALWPVAARGAIA
jgi:D-serine deaminase-like pyridoxal phosphate-dependent protein